MDIKQSGGKLFAYIKKYRYAVLILVIGIILMLIPGKSDEQTSDGSETAEPDTSISCDITKELSDILAQIEGVGKVNVMLTVKTGAQTIYQTDEHSSTTENGSTIQKDTVIISGSERQEHALITHTVSPVYLGAIIVCQGADTPSVKLAIIDAVSKITGLSSDKISVVKMK